jgi:integrase
MRVCKPFNDQHGNAIVGNLKKHHLTTWLASRTTWGASMKSLACTVIIRALNWAVEEELIPHNPLAGYKGRPRPKSRGADVLITPEEHQQIIAAAPRPLQLYLRALRDSGARPGEIASLEARHWHAESKTFHLGEHKTDRNGHKKRVYFSTAFLEEVVYPQMKKHPTGPLFPNRNGRKWRNSSYELAFRKIRRQLGLREELIPYGYRHTVATDLLKKKVPVAFVTQVLGHKDTKMLDHHYSHLMGETEAIRAELDRVRSEPQQ